jgi:hypothetical protein
LTLGKHVELQEAWLRRFEFNNASDHGQAPNLDAYFGGELWEPDKVAVYLVRGVGKSSVLEIEVPDWEMEGWGVTSN